VEGNERGWKGMEEGGREWKRVEGNGSGWKGMKEGGRE